MKQAIERNQDPVEFNTVFHETLVKATDNFILWSVYHTLDHLLAESRTADVQSPTRTKLSVAAHAKNSHRTGNRGFRCCCTGQDPLHGPDRTLFNYF